MLYFHFECQSLIFRCKHYFCERCALKSFKRSPKCPVCNENTNGVMNAVKPTMFKKKKKQECHEHEHEHEHEHREEEEGVKQEDEDEEEGEEIKQEDLEEEAEVE